MAAKKNKRGDTIGRLPQWNDDVLRNSANEVPLAYLKTSEFKSVVKRMFSMIKWAVGLAANQIGVPLRIAVIEIKRTATRPDITPVPPSVIVNPVILKYSKELQYGWEGCISMPRPGLFFFVPRAKRIKVRYFNEKGEKVTKELNGFPAIVFQHEIDHLNGKFCGEQVMVLNGHVPKGAILTRKEYKKNPRQIPEGVRHLVKKLN